ncbi:MAG TPA: hypothetical protein VJP90_06265, partial [Paenarthrobacter sp.]|nr:hypothetical protein [Paenarthrobacter sp.]
ASTLLFKLIPYITATLFLAGVAQALYLRKTNPLKYETIGHVAMGEDGQGPVLDEEDPEPLRPIDLNDVRELENQHVTDAELEELEMEKEQS